MKNIKKIPAKTEKAIYQEANSRCPFCDENDVTTLEIHHIMSRAENGSNELDNLILCCANCHSKITNDVINVHEVYKMKRELMRRTNQATIIKNKKPHSKVLQFPKQKSTFSSNVIQFNESVNEGVITNSLHIHNINKAIKVQPSVDIIAANGDKRSYIKHLIDRYNDFKKADKIISDFRYSMIYVSIKNKFKCKWDFIPLNRFSELAEFLQYRIDNTIIGKNRRKQGQKNYSTFDEYIKNFR